MRNLPTTKERAVGRWKSILPAFGVTPQQLTGKHGPCPLCGGKDRFRFDLGDVESAYVEMLKRITGSSS